MAEVPYDYNKTPRPQGGKHDIGAYEFGVLSAPTPAPASNLLISQSTILTTNRRLKTGDTLSQYENRKKGRKNQNHGNLADLFKDLKPAKES